MYNKHMENKKDEQIKLSIKKQLIWFCVIVVILVLLAFLQSSPSISEWWTKTISRGWIWLFGNIFGWLPVSVYEILVFIAVVAVIVLIITIIKNLVKRKGKAALKLFLNGVCIALSIVCLYSAIANFSYNRKELPISVFNGEINREEVEEIAEYYIFKINAVSARLERDENNCVISPYSTRQLSRALSEQFKRLNNDYFSPFTPQAKGILTSFIMSETHITGIFFAPTGEPNVNTISPAAGLPVTMAHEMAHAKGVMRENDANMTAYYICLTAEDDYILYSGLYSLVYRVLAAVSYYPDSLSSYKELLLMLDEDIRDELDFEREYWNQHSSLSKIENKINDFFLKLSGEKGGTDSYLDKNANIYDENNKDGDGRPIATVIDFSRTQRLIFMLFKNAQI